VNGISPWLQRIAPAAVVCAGVGILSAMPDLWRLLL
jgi:hypothetical protein